MFEGSVADNIRFGRPDATERGKVAGRRRGGRRRNRFVDGLPDGYDTDVAKRGGRLFGRAAAGLVRVRPRVPRRPGGADSPTKPPRRLDIPSERMVQRALETVLGRPGPRLVIAHRLSTVQVADRVLVLDHGPPRRRRRTQRADRPRQTAGMRRCTAGVGGVVWRRSPELHSRGPLLAHSLRGFNRPNMSATDASNLGHARSLHRQ